MRFSVMLDSNTTVHDIPKVLSDHGGTWSKIKLKKIYYNYNTSVTTEKIAFIKINEIDNDNYFKVSGGRLLNYTYSYFVTDSWATDELRIHTSADFQPFKDKNIKQLNIEVYDSTGTLSAISSSYYILLEFELE